MDISSIPLFERISQRMAWLGERTRVLSQNIANADTPGYRPKDVVPLDFDAEMRRLSPVAPRRTSPQHLSGTVPPSGDFDSKNQKKIYEQSSQENGVVIEEQMMKLSESQVTYNMMVNLYRKHVDMFKTAIGRNG